MRASQSIMSLSGAKGHPFGSCIQGRAFSSAAYRYGFNAKEKEADGTADNYDFGARIYDGRLGRWLAVDPLFRNYTSYSVYSSVFNCPLMFIDSDGRQIVKPETKISYSGPAAPTCLGEIAHTNPSASFRLNNTTNAYDFYIITEIIYSSSMDELVKINGDNFRGYIQKHEEEHIARNHRAAEETYKFDGVFNNKKISLEGTLDVIASTVYTDEVLPIKEKLTAEKYKLFDDALAEFEEITKSMDVTSEEYIVANDNYRNKVNNIRSEYDAKELEVLSNFNSQILDNLMSLYIQRNSVLQEHQGPTGVIRSALKNMSPEEAEYDDKIIYDQNNNEIQNCSETEH
jgi:RHS repeat-associated protein